MPKWSESPKGDHVVMLTPNGRLPPPQKKCLKKEVAWIPVAKLFSSYFCQIMG